jgi:hypothetical protein
MSNILWVCDGSYWVNLYGEVTLVNNVTKTQDVVVLTDEIYLVSGGYIHNGDDVARLVQVQHFTSAGKLLDQLVYHAALAAGQRAFFPSQLIAGGDTITHGNSYPMVLGSGDYIRYTWTAGGASAGGIAGYVLKYKRLC